MSTNRKIAVLTGGLGYIGKHLAIYLLRQHWEVTLLVRPSSDIANCRELAQCRFMEYDGTIASFDRLQICNDTHNAQVVFFHLAANTEIRDELSAIDSLIESNFQLGTHLLCYMARHNFRNIVAAESYWQFDDQGNLGGNSIYATSKSAFSMLLKYFSRYGVRSIALVLYDIYGPQDERGKLVNALVHSAVNQVAIDVTPGDQLLDYVYIDDVVRAFDIAGSSLLTSSEIGGGFRRHTIRTLEVGRLKDFVNILSRAVGQSPPLRWGGKSYPAHQILHPWFPPKNMQLPGWQAEYNFFSGIRKILEYG